jgi:putative glutamine amidotransferase
MCLVAVTMRSAPADSYVEERDALSHDMSRLLFVRGLVPILVPNTTPDPVAFLAASGARALMLTGGDDLGPLGGTEGPASPSLRDTMEHRLLMGALERGLPVLGICRGLQLVNVAFGGGLTRRLDDVVPQERHVGGTHAVTLVDGGQADVNSFHASGVVGGQLAAGLRATAVTAGGVVEALEHPTLPVAAVQWHPERPGPSAALDDAILARWIAACR